MVNTSLCVYINTTSPLYVQQLFPFPLFPFFLYSWKNLCLRLVFLLIRVANKYNIDDLQY